MPVNLLYALLPYLAVGAGLLLFSNAWAAILAYHVGIILVLLLGSRKISFGRVVRSNSAGHLALAAAIGAGGGLALYALWPLLEVPPDISGYMNSIGLTAGTWPFFLAYYALVNPFMEEYYWRWRLGSDSSRPVLNDLLFAGYHLVVLAGKMDALWLAAVLLVLSGAAWYWRQATRLTGGLLAAVLSHMMADITVITTIFLLTAG